MSIDQVRSLKPKEATRDVVSESYSAHNRWLHFLNWVPQFIRRAGARFACWKAGLEVVELCSGWGNNARALSALTGRWGKIYCVEREPRSHVAAKSKHLRLANVEFILKDIFVFEIPEGIASFYLSFAYCTLQGADRRKALLKRLWAHLPEGGRIVMLEAGIDPDSLWRFTLPFWAWFLRRNLMSDPYIVPRDELGDVVGRENVYRERIFLAYYVVYAEKPKRKQ